MKRRGGGGEKEMEKRTRKEGRNERRHCLREFSGDKAFIIPGTTFIKPWSHVNSAFPFCGEDSPPCTPPHKSTHPL